MAPEKSPAFQFYPDLFLTDENQAVMSLDQVGIYARLMCYCWRELTIPDDPAKLARLVGGGITTKRMEALWPGVRVCFTPDADQPARLRHPRLDQERLKQAEWHDVQSENGKLGAAKRWGRHRKPSGVAMGSPSSGHSDPNGEQMPLHSPSPVQIPSGSDHTARFARFWEAYPSKVGRKAAEARFRALKVSDPLLEIMLAAIDAQRRTRRWREGYIPNPATWLHQGRWDDEIERDPALERAIGPDYRNDDDWFAQCQHEPRCGSRRQHRERLDLDAEKARLRQGAA
jgi:uncharacterized protein YdaU (DUF1376 family)